jgi:hypothetical protein
MLKITMMIKQASWAAQVVLTEQNPPFAERER